MYHSMMEFRTLSTSDIEGGETVLNAIFVVVILNLCFICIAFAIVVNDKYFRLPDTKPKALSREEQKRMEQEQKKIEQFNEMMNYTAGRSENDW